ncbi:methyltransferase domain-containing protein [Arthrobacter sp. ISL-48]|uniref:class I SAM-dependent methyltransferase n=1 Tax=Arthrobacter sp. ISL-48 TaxID=2819110 RepID=UPI001BE51192|nr:class I SAM-dependent methyltransferase [Arthrobacter sp. ISL-48]MBT2531339.1 methyltransferase domain-containing protein [Arthrobacter sp. ISL-48]
MRRRASDAVETMDLPDCDPVRLERTYRQFAVVNRALSGWRRLYAIELRPLLSAESTTSVLDIGSGGGDLAVTLAGWAARDKVKLHVTGIDPDSRAHTFAGRRPHIAGVEFRQAHSSTLLREGRRYDVVISNHVLHHLQPEELQQLLADSRALARRKALHNDLRRSPAAYALFFVAALPFRGSFIRADGLTSIRRSYTPAELAELAPAGWHSEPRSPFHQLLALRKDRPDD